MNEIFRQHVEQLHAKFEALMEMEPVTLTNLPRDIPQSGIYLFSEGPSHLYVGRSKRIRDRLKYHCGPAKDAPFAFKLARELTGHTKASYSKSNSREQLLADPVFQAAFQAAKERIRRMHIRFAEEPDPNGQALLEIYATIALRARYNDFDTH
jgi:hypothetical protein